MIPYVENDDTCSIAMLIEPLDMMAYYLRTGLVDHPKDNTEENYTMNCVDLCNISTFTIAKELSRFADDEELTVHEGVFNMQGNHTWLQIGDTIIDATLAQFIAHAKPLSMVDASWDAYSSVRSYTFSEWQKHSPLVA